MVHFIWPTMLEFAFKKKMSSIVLKAFESLNEIDGVGRNFALVGVVANQGQGGRQPQLQGQETKRNAFKERKNVTPKTGVAGKVRTIKQRGLGGVMRPPERNTPAGPARHFPLVI